MAKQYGEVVTFVKGDVKANALVVQSTERSGEENLTLVYLDPAKASPLLSGQSVDAAIQRVFVTPLKEGKTFGWEELSEPAEAPKSSSDYLVESLMPHLIELSNTVATIAPSMEISPEGTVISANTLLQQILLKKPEPAPAQPADAAPAGTDFESALKKAGGIITEQADKITSLQADNKALADELESIHAKLAEVEKELSQTTEGIDKQLQALADENAVKPKGNVIVDGDVFKPADPTSFADVQAAQAAAKEAAPEATADPTSGEAVSSTAPDTPSPSPDSPSSDTSKDSATSE